MGILGAGVVGVLFEEPGTGGDVIQIVEPITVTVTDPVTITITVDED